MIDEKTKQQLINTKVGDKLTVCEPNWGLTKGKEYEVLAIEPRPAAGHYELDRLVTVKRDSGEEGQHFLSRFRHAPPPVVQFTHGQLFQAAHEAMTELERRAAKGEALLTELRAELASLRSELAETESELVEAENASEELSDKVDELVNERAEMQKALDDSKAKLALVAQKVDKACDGCSMEAKKQWGDNNAALVGACTAYVMVKTWLKA
jgi:uncharacterized coiled-coil protein SlyX